MKDDIKNALARANDWLGLYQNDKVYFYDELQNDPLGFTTLESLQELLKYLQRAEYELRTQVYEIEAQIENPL